MGVTAVGELSTLRAARLDEPHFVAAREATEARDVAIIAMSMALGPRNTIRSGEVPWTPSVARPRAVRRPFA